ncbi:MAG: NAD-dependent epimerase/dehydratase family protein [Candidatus Micrarchaeota archaeon]
MEDVLVGGSGFVGTHIARSLEKQERRFRILDMRPCDDRLGKFEYCDISKPIVSIADGVDTLYHLAALRNPRTAQDALEATFTTNVIGTYNVCSWARKRDVKKIVFFSSYAIYGNQSESCSEKTLPSPCNNYGFSKLQGELIVSNFCRSYGIRCTILRPAPLYGGGLREGLGADLVVKALNNGRLEFKGSGKQTRQYLHIDDLLDGLAVIAKQQTANVDIYNLGGETSVSVKEIAELISQKMDSIPVSFGGSDGDFSGDIVKPVMDCAKIFSAGWTRQRKFERFYPDYLDAVISWARR